MLLALYSYSLRIPLLFRDKPPTRKSNKVSLKLCISLLYTLGILLSAFFNVWGSKGFRTAPIPNKQAGLSSSVAQNSDTFMRRKCSGKSTSIYCCIRFHPSQCVSPMDRWLIQILLIIGDVEQNPGPSTNSPEGKDNLSPNRSVAKDAPKCSPKAKRKERTLVTKSATKKEKKKRKNG